MAVAGARAGLGLGAVTCLAVALGGWVALRHSPDARRGRIRAGGLRTGRSVTAGG